MHTPENTIANQKVALEKRLNEIRRLEGVKTKLLEALEVIKSYCDERVEHGARGDWDSLSDVANTAIAEAKGA